MALLPFAPVAIELVLVTNRLYSYWLQIRTHSLPLSLPLLLPLSCYYHDRGSGSGSGCGSGSGSGSGYCTGNGGGNQPSNFCSYFYSTFAGYPAPPVAFLFLVNKNTNAGPLLPFVMIALGFYSYFNFCFFIFFTIANAITTVPLGHWAIGPLGHWAIGPLGHWAIGPLGHWDNGRIK